MCRKGGIYIFYDEIYRLKYIDFALRGSYRRVMDSAEEEWSMELVPSIVECLLWLMTADEWHRKNKLYSSDFENSKNKSDEGKILLGLRRSFNLFKHEMSFAHLFRAVETKEIFGKYSLEIFNESIKWAEVPKLSYKDKDNQVTNYKEYLQDEKVIFTLKEAFRFIRKANSEAFEKSSIDN